MRLPRSFSASTPARSSASHDVSSNNRCCGSIASASRGEIPKNPASNSATSGRNPPVWENAASAATLQPRSAGKSPIPSLPAAIRSQSFSGEVASPGNRQAMATMTTGSSASAAVGATDPADVGSASPPNSRVRNSTAAASGVGWSKTSVAGRRTPVAAVSRLRRSTAVRESKPRSLKGFDGVMASAPRCPSARAAAVLTRSRSSRSRSPSVDPASLAASSDSPAAGSVVAARAASGMASMRGRGRAAVNVPAKRSQSMSVTVSVVSSWSRACWSAPIARSGSIERTPPRARSRARSSSTIPPPAQLPQATEVAVRPRLRRSAASASAYALAAAYAPWPALPQIAAPEEKRTNASRS
ncbi:hypothetical protein Save01_02231 [Streptomyces avermitilis]